jgi:hypothetical protein
MPGKYTVKLEGKCDGSTYSHTSEVEIKGPPVALELTQVSLNLNNTNYGGRTFHLEVQYDGVTRAISNSALISSFPYSFYFPANLLSGTHVIGNLIYVPAKEIRIKVWQDDVNEVIKNYTCFTLHGFRGLMAAG